MTDLRKYARGKPCMIRIPGVCSHDPEKVVWCHVRMVDISGAGLKAPDYCGAFGCSPCHDVVDGRQKSDFTADERRLLLLDAMVRSQTYMAARGVKPW